MDAYIIKAVYLASKSPFRHKIGAVIINKKGKVIATGTNIRKTHPQQYLYAKKTGNEKRIYLHAEISALVKCRQKPHSIYVIRVNNKGELRLAKPCDSCMLALEHANISNIYYSNNNGEIECITL